MGEENNEVIRGNNAKRTQEASTLISPDGYVLGGQICLSIYMGGGGGRVGVEGEWAQEEDEGKKLLRLRGRAESKGLVISD